MKLNGRSIEIGINDNIIVGRWDKGKGVGGIFGERNCWNVFILFFREFFVGMVGCLFGYSR